MAFWPFSPRGKRASRNAQEREQKENSTTRTTVESGPKKALLKRKNKHGTGAAAKSSDAGVRRPDIRGNDTSDVQAPAATAVNAAGVESTNPSASAPIANNATATNTQQTQPLQDNIAIENTPNAQFTENRASANMHGAAPIVTVTPSPAANMPYTTQHTHSPIIDNNLSSTFLPRDSRFFEHPREPPQLDSSIARSPTGSVKRRKSEKHKRPADLERGRHQPQLPASLAPRRSASWSGFHSTSNEGDASNTRKKGRHGGKKDEVPASIMSQKTESAYDSGIDMEAYTFRIKTFDALTPRPLIRCSELQPAVPPTALTTVSTEASSSARQGSNASSAVRQYYHQHHGSNSTRVIPPVKPEDRSRKIDGLADGLDAGALRELMERDQRRKELRRQAEARKREAKLARRASRERRMKEREEEARRRERERDEVANANANANANAIANEDAGLKATGGAAAVAGASPFVAPEAGKEAKEVPEPAAMQEQPEQHQQNGANRGSWATNASSADATAVTATSGAAAARQNPAAANGQASVKFAAQQQPSQEGHRSSPLAQRADSSETEATLVSQKQPQDQQKSQPAAAAQQPRKSPDLGSRIASLFRRGSRLRRAATRRGNNNNQEKQKEAPSQDSRQSSQTQSLTPPPTQAPPGFCVPSRESIKRESPTFSSGANGIGNGSVSDLSPPPSIVDPRNSGDRTPSPSIVRARSKFTELLDYPIPTSESGVYRMVSGEGSEGLASRSLASVTEDASAEAGKKSGENQGGRPALASPEPIPETEHEQDQENEGVKQAEEQNYDAAHDTTHDSCAISVHSAAPIEETAAITRSLASIDSEGSWFSSHLSRRLSVNTAKTQAKIQKYRRSATSMSPAASRASYEPTEHENSHLANEDDYDDEEERQAGRDADMAQPISPVSLDAVSVHPGASKERIVVHQASPFVAHAIEPEIGSTENLEEEEQLAPASVSAPAPFARNYNEPSSVTTFGSDEMSELAPPKGLDVITAVDERPTSLQVLEIAASGRDTGAGAGAGGNGMGGAARAESPVFYAITE